MTDADRILKAALKAVSNLECDCEGCRDYVRPVVIAVLEELTNFLGDHWTYEELLELADEIEGSQ